MDYKLGGNNVIKFTHQLDRQYRQALKLKKSETFFKCINDETSISKCSNKVLKTFDKFSSHIMNMINSSYLSNVYIKGFILKLKFKNA